MSSILKAIRKAEDEKRAGDSVAPDLMVDHGQSTPKSRPAMLFPLSIGVVVGVLLAGAGILMLDDGSNSTLEANKDNRAGLQEAPSVVAERAPLLSNKQVVADGHAEKPLAPDAAGADEIVKKEVIVSEPVHRIADDRTAKVVNPTTSKPEEAKVKKTVANTEPAQTFSVPPGVHLVVSEIYYQEDDASSMAVVNDLPVMMGTYVDSAIVTAINKNSVMFELDGNSFLVPVSRP